MKKITLDHYVQDIYFSRSIEDHLEEQAFVINELQQGMNLIHAVAKQHLL